MASDGVGKGKGQRLCKPLTCCFLGGDEGARTLDPRLANVPHWLRVESLSVQDMPSDLRKGRRAFLCGSTPIHADMARSDDKMLTSATRLEDPICSAIQTSAAIADCRRLVSVFA